MSAQTLRVLNSSNIMEAPHQPISTHFTHSQHLLHSEDAKLRWSRRRIKWSTKTES